MPKKWELISIQLMKFCKVIINNSYGGMSVCYAFIAIRYRG